MFMASNGFRAVAHDRRGHGRSTQSWVGNDMDQYADDLAAVIETLDLRDIVLVGHSTGGGEVTRYIGRHGTDAVSRVVLVGAVPPLMLKTAANPDGTPIEAFDEIRAGVLADRSQSGSISRSRSSAPTGPDRRCRRASLDGFWLQGMQVGLKAAYDCIKQFSESDFNDDLKKVDVPMLVIQGDDDQIVPIDDSGRLTVADRPERGAEGVPGRAARPVRDAHRSVQLRPTRLRQTVS